MFTTFRGGQTGGWRIISFRSVKGEALTPAPALSVTHASSIALPILPSRTAWRLAGVASHPRYTERAEAMQLADVQDPLGRAEAACAALIPFSSSKPS